MRSISPFGPSRHFAWAQQSGRFWREADINGWARLGESVVIDPNRAFGNDGNLHQALASHDVRAPGKQQLSTNT